MCARNTAAAACNWAMHALTIFLMKTDGRTQFLFMQLKWKEIRHDITWQRWQMFCIYVAKVCVEEKVAAAVAGAGW